MKDYYELLEVNKNASEDTIKKVFRLLIKKNHPDLFEGKEKIEAEERVKELNEAYAILIDKEKREKYNRELEERKVNTNLDIQTLIKENEYLKSKIHQKDEMINEYLREEDSNLGLFARIFQKDLESQEEIDENKKVQTQAYDLYQVKQKARQIMYIIMMSIMGMIVLSVITGINFFRIVIEVLKNMF